MNEELVSSLIGASYSRLASDALKSRGAKRDELLRHRKLPREGWSEAEVKSFLADAAAMDANAWEGVAGGGEREGRVVCPWLADGSARAAGVGRSGDVAALQPKAPGSSLVCRLAEALALDAARMAGLRSVQAALLLPTATGMALLLTFLSLRPQRPKATKVLWSRIDQKTCFKAIAATGLEPVVLETKLEGDALVTEMEALRSLVESLGDSLLCVVTTTSCFAPRLPDDVQAVAALCRDKGLPHVLNNAYGLQSSKLTHVVEQAGRSGRVDVVVQSTDKNFLVPVGGALVLGFRREPVDAVAKAYPGRGSATPSRDLLSTLLWLGAPGLKRLLAERKDVFAALREGLSGLAGEVGERVLETGPNPISLAMTLDGLSKEDVGRLGSALFSRRVTGARVFARSEPPETKEVAGTEFRGWGSHHAAYPHSYLNLAAAIGMRLEEVELIIARLRKAINEIKAKACGKEP